MLVDRTISFFLEHAGELHFVILRRKKGTEPLQHTHRQTQSKIALLVSSSLSPFKTGVHFTLDAGVR